jgi:hypothetical protein
MLGGSGVQEKRLDLTGHHGAQILTGRVAGLEGRTRNKLAIRRISEALRTKQES